MTNELPPSRAMPDCNEASVRSDGFKNSRPSTLPASAWGSGCAFQPPRERQQLLHLLARQFGEIDETLHSVLPRLVRSSPRPGP